MLFGYLTLFRQDVTALVIALSQPMSQAVSRVFRKLFIAKQHQPLAALVGNGHLDQAFGKSRFVVALVKRFTV